MLPGHVLYFLKSYQTSVFFPLRRLRRKVSRAKGNPFIKILEYSTPRPKSKTQIWISNSVGAKFSRWHLGINSFWRQMVSSLELSCRHLGINSVWRQLGSPLGFAISGYSLSGIPPCFPSLGFTLIICSCGTTYFPVGYLLEFSFLGELHFSYLLFTPLWIILYVSLKQIYH